MRFLIFVAACSPFALAAGPASAQHRPSEGQIACELQLSTCKAPAVAARADEMNGSVVVDDGTRAWCIPGMACAKTAPPPKQQFAAQRRPDANAGRNPRLGREVRSYRSSPPSPAVGRRITAAKSDMQLTFENNSATLSADAKDRIAAYARTLVAAPEVVNFRVEGHTSSVGTRVSNLDLSRRRAAAVTEYMVSLGVPRDRLTPVGYGFDAPLSGRPAASDHNRRVEIVRK